MECTYIGDELDDRMSFNVFFGWLNDDLKEDFIFKVVGIGFAAPSPTDRRPCRQQRFVNLLKKSCLYKITSD